MAHAHWLGLRQIRPASTETLQHVRILLAGMSKMLSSIIMGALAQDPDIVVGQVGEGRDLASEILLTSADAVIVQTSLPGAAADFVQLLRACPTLRVVAIDSTGGSGFVHELRLHSIPLAELSADVLRSALYAPSAPTPSDIG
jgi:hypothetical protein